MGSVASNDYVTLIRRRIAAIALAFVACQLTGMAATPSAVWSMTAPDAGTSPIVCTCAHGSSEECPMHKHQKPASSSDTRSSGSRWCKGPQGNVEGVLTGLFAWAGQLVPRHLLSAPEPGSEAVRAADEPSLTFAPARFFRPPRS
jgi:hypothetical protein